MKFGAFGEVDSKKGVAVVKGLEIAFKCYEVGEFQNDLDGYGTEVQTLQPRLQFTRTKMKKIVIGFEDYYLS